MKDTQNEIKQNIQGTNRKEGRTERKPVFKSMSWNKRNLRNKHPTRSDQETRIQKNEEDSLGQIIGAPEGEEQ